MVTEQYQCHLMYDNIYRYDGRLIFKDLNSNSLLNGVQTSSLSQLWTPQLAFINALGPYQTVVDDISVCTIVLEKTPTFNDLTQILECMTNIHPNICIFVNFRLRI